MATKRVGARFERILSGDAQASSVVIAEVGLNHNGDLRLAKQLIDSAVMAGCDIAKFQKRDVKNLAIGSVLDAEDKRFPEFGSTYREIREHLEFTFEEYQQLVRYCDDRGIEFLCTAFDTESVDFITELGLNSLKIASHSLTNLPLLKYIAAKGIPSIMSTGMCTLEEIDAAVDTFRSADCRLVLMHCVSSYPTPFNQCNLSMIQTLKDRYKLPVGYSGHEIGWVPTLAAIAMGAVCIERHITLDKGMIGFDHKLSLTPDELFQMVRDIRSVEAAIGPGTKQVTDVEMVTRKKYHVSVVSAVDITEGEVIKTDMLTLKNPGTGLPASMMPQIVGRKAKQTIRRDSLLDMSMFS